MLFLGSNRILQLEQHNYLCSFHTCYLNKFILTFAQWLPRQFRVCRAMDLLQPHRRTESYQRTPRRMGRVLERRAGNRHIATIGA